MQNITCNQTQQVSGGTLGVDVPQMQQLAIMTGFVLPKALIGAGLSALRMDPNAIRTKVVTESISVVTTGIAMMAGNYFYQDGVAAKNQTAV
jgi:hypothetical protein